MISTQTALIVDDEPQIRLVVRRALAPHFGRILEASDARSAVLTAAAEQPSLIVLDLGLPDRDGLEVCREIRGWSEAAILVLSARDSDVDKATLLNAGADDYVTKPFSTVEFEARAGALLRRAVRSGSGGKTTITAGDLSIDLVGRTVSRSGAIVHLTPTEWELLKAMATRPNRTLTHQQLFAYAWRGRSAGDAQAHLRVHVAHLRRKLEADAIRPQHIITESGVGYRFQP